MFESTSQPTILVVEDEPDILYVLQRLVLSIVPECAVIAVNNAAEGLAVIEMHKVELIITDYSMADMNGISFARAIKVLTPDTRVLLISGFITPLLELQAEMTGVDAYLAKPFLLDQFIRIIQETLTGSLAYTVPRLSDCFAA